MPIGAIPHLKQTVLDRTFEAFNPPPELVLTNLFGSEPADSDKIQWTTLHGSRGMAPVIPPDTPSPLHSLPGHAKHEAQAMFWSEKIPFSENFLNNLADPSNPYVKQSALSVLSRGMKDLSNRSYRRKEWTFAKMMTAGGFDYVDSNKMTASVDYGIPAAQRVTLSSDYKWGTGTKADMLGDIITAKQAVNDETGAFVSHAMFNSTVLKLLTTNDKIIALLQKNAFGDGNLFGGPDMHSILGRSKAVIQRLLDIDNFIEYNDGYNARAWLTASVTGGATTTVSVNDARDFEAGGTLRFYNATTGAYEEKTVSSVDAAANTVTVSEAPAKSYRALYDYVEMKRKFIPDNTIVFFASSVGGDKIATFMEPPFGLSGHRGIQPDAWDKKDPDLIYVRLQGKGLPILYHPEAVYILKVE